MTAPANHVVWRGVAKKKVGPTFAGKLSELIRVTESQAEKSRPGASNRTAFVAQQSRVWSELLVSQCHDTAAQISGDGNVFGVSGRHWHCGAVASVVMVDQTDAENGIDLECLQVVLLNARPDDLGVATRVDEVSVEHQDILLRRGG